VAKIVEGRKASDFTLNDGQGPPGALADFHGEWACLGGTVRKRWARVADAARHPPRPSTRAARVGLSPREARWSGTMRHADRRSSTSHT